MYLCRLRAAAQEIMQQLEAKARTGQLSNVVQSPDDLQKLSTLLMQGAALATGDRYDGDDDAFKRPKVW